MPPERSLLPTTPGWGVRDVLGTPLQCTSYEHLIQFCQWRTGQPGTIAVDFTNTHIVTLRRHEPWFRDVTASFDYFIPDAMPLTWILNRRGAAMRDRVYGPTFMRKCVLASGPPLTHYFLGGSSECVGKLRQTFLAANPELRIVGIRNGYFGPEAEAGIVEEINALSPDFVWVGLGTPKQQQFIQRNKAKIRRGIVFAVGFAFDVNAGTKRDAPAWMQRLGLTWLYRMASEPARLGPRYFKYNSLFLFYLLWSALRPARRRENGEGARTP